MTHVFFFILLISFAIGVGVIFLFVTLYQRYRRPVLAYFLFVLVCLGLAIFSDLFTVYINLTLVGSPALLASLITVSAIVYHLSMGGLVYSLPQFAGQLVSRPVAKTARTFLLVLMLFYPLGVIAYFLTRQEIYATLGDGLLLLVIAHTLYCLFPRQRDAENQHLRKVANVMLFLLTFFLPLFFLEVIFAFVFPQSNSLFFDASSFLLLFYLVWNLTLAAYLYRQFTLAFKSRVSGLSDAMMAEHGLSKREQEIARLVAQGASNKQIAAALSISVLTIKNHIYNIYKKTGANSRVDLVNLLGGKDVA